MISPVPVPIHNWTSVNSPFADTKPQFPDRRWKTEMKAAHPGSQGNPDYLTYHAYVVQNLATQ